MGSAALYHLARRGKRVLGIERFDIPHELGSSHGITRIIRLAYFEHPSYVPLVQRAYELWRELEREAGEQLLHVTGAVEGGPRIFEGALRSCHEHDLPHEALDGAEVGRRFPAYRLPPDLQLVYQPDGGFVAPRALHRRARERSARRTAPSCGRASGCSSGRRARTACGFAPTAARSRRSGSC